jgi:hypothetical protein
MFMYLIACLLLAFTCLLACFLFIRHFMLVYAFDCFYLLMYLFVFADVFACIYFFALLSFTCFAFAAGWRCGCLVYWKRTEDCYCDRSQVLIL